MSLEANAVLKRIRSHANIIGAAVITASGVVIASVGVFTERDARRCARFASVAASAVESDEGEEDDDDATSGCGGVQEDEIVELARARHGHRELVVSRSGRVILAAFVRCP
jgi:hypothetical protein